MKSGGKRYSPPRWDPASKGSRKAAARARLAAVLSADGASLPGNDGAVQEGGAGHGRDLEDAHGSLEEVQEA